MKVYPNPATNSLVVTTPEANGTLQLLDVTGRQVAEQKVTATTNTFDIQPIPRGAYISVWTSSAGEVQVERVIVQ